MKKLLVVVLAMAVALSFGSMAMAKDGLSVDLGFAMNFNGADMGKSIVKDGEEGAGEGPLGYAVMPENMLLAASKDATLRNVIASVSEGGAMQGLNTALRVRYNFLNSFFARIGFVYDWQIMGGETSFKFTSNVSQVLAAEGSGTTDPSNAVWQAINTHYGSLNGAKVSQTWTYGYWAIPVTIGLNVPINDGKYNIYAGLGLTYYSGFWQLEVTVPANYFAPVGTNQSAATEKAKFEISGIGFNYTIGASAEVYQDVSIFIEWDATIAAGMSDSVRLKTDAGKTAFGVDNIYYPVNLSTSLLRFGVNYRLPVAL